MPKTKTKWRRSVNAEDLKSEAENLKSEGIENPEYDRALLELTTYALGGHSGDFIEMGEMLGMSAGYVRSFYAVKPEKVRK